MGRVKDAFFTGTWREIEAEREYYPEPDEEDSEWVGCSDCDDAGSEQDFDTDSDGLPF